MPERSSRWGTAVTVALVALVAAVNVLMLTGMSWQHTVTKTVFAPATRAIPPSAIRVPPETARIPDGVEEQRTLHLRSLTIGATAFGTVQASNFGVNLVGGFEGFSSCPYWDPFGRVWTRGYGETDFGGNFGGRCISRSFGLSNLRRLLNAVYLAPVRSIGGSFNQCEIDAMGSASYNLGPGIIYSHASQLRRHEAGFLLGYVHAGGVTLPGLVTRRRAEVSLFYSHRCGHVETAAERRAKARRALPHHEHRIVEIRANILRLHRVIGARQCAPGGHRHAQPRHTHAQARQSRRECNLFLRRGGAEHQAGNREHALVNRLRREAA